MQATIDCLIELGYAGTTTNEIQLRAGVSRGALTHHFASKADLMLAAMDYLYEDFSASIRSSAATLPSGEERIRPAIRMLWERFNGSLFRAAMELWVAARTDSELRTALLPHERQLGVQLRELAAELFGDVVATHPAAETVYQVLLTSMRGQAMTYALKPEASQDGPHLQNWFALVEAFTRP